MEEWKTISDFPDYECSNLGNFKRAKPGKGAVAGKVRTPYKNSVTGYMSVTLSGAIDPSIPKTQAAHKLIAKTWLPNPRNYEFVGFKDKDKSNLAADNLFWHQAHDLSIKWSIDVTNIVTKEKWVGLRLSEAYKITNLSEYNLKKVLNGEKKVKDWIIVGTNLDNRSEKYTY
jgi:hypothetical protein